MYLQRINTTTFDEARRTIRTVIIPVGSLEGHGLHCALGTDNLIPEEICRRIEEQAGDRVFIAPTIPYGHTWELQIYPGTVNISGETFVQYVTEVGRGLVGWGLENVILLNGHGGNVGGLGLAAEKIAEATGTSADGQTIHPKVAIINWWLDFRPDILKHCETTGHAGEDETSAVLGIDTRLVDMSKASHNTYEPKWRVRQVGIGHRTMKDAITGDARKATPEKGEAILTDVTARCLEAIGWVERGE